MKKEQQPKPEYEAPKVEFVEVEIENGFAASGTMRDWNNGGHLGDYDVE